MRARQARGIWAKMNSLVDPVIIEKLYEASAAGVNIELVVRGVCCLRPGVAGLSGKYPRQIDRRPLPRACAPCGVSPMASTPPCRRARLHQLRRLDASATSTGASNICCRSRIPTVHAQLLDQVMVANLLDNQQSWRLMPDGTFCPPHGKPADAFNLHQYFMTNVSLSGAARR
jgi:polyphosphate kinase